MAKNGKAPEVIYEDGTSAESADNGALDRAVATGGPVDCGDYVATAEKIPEAAVLHLRGGKTTVLFVRYGDIAPRYRWYAVARFDPKTVGSHEFVMARQWRTEVTVRHLAEVEFAFGRENWPGYHHHLHVEGEHAEPVEVEGAMLTKRDTGLKLLRVKHRGVWLGVTSSRRKTQAIQQDDPRMAAIRQRGYPDLSIV